MGGLPGEAAQAAQERIARQQPDAYKAFRLLFWRVALSGMGRLLLPGCGAAVVSRLNPAIQIALWHVTLRHIALGTLLQAVRGAIIATATVIADNLFHIFLICFFILLCFLLFSFLCNVKILIFPFYHTIRILTSLHRFILAISTASLPLFQGVPPGPHSIKSNL